MYPYKSVSLASTLQRGSKSHTLQRHETLVPIRNLGRWSGHNGVPTLERGNESIVNEHYNALF